ncbi:MAG: putative zinc-binding metallopeptidase [Sandaracinus sp.]|nr:putative zinc-binding metallopeptidase [Sandaracinus sp.]MCB9625107.1 putative zinc-binding metallopeptidase [Sandaracinus sp.]MCB9634332.1 putative zinc-binding metallopeptidase [Sandaracinus sp.]
MRRSPCPQCDLPVAPNDLRCLACGCGLVFDPFAGRIRRLEDATPCRHRDRLGCSWQASSGGACESCARTAVVPNLDDAQNVTRLARLEAAKRLALLAHLRFGLRLPSREDHPEGLVFELVDDVVHPDGTVEAAMTGHLAGTIRVAVAEADEVERVERKVAMRERFRTLVGHFRHELGHYFWDRLVRDGGALEAFRERFGDERVDYGEALARYHAEGAPSDWASRFVSRYASAHPWEDFAETWAHVIHVADALDTAADHGLHVRDTPRVEDPWREASAQSLVDAWVPLALATNGLGRSLGQPDLYPFVLTPTVTSKMQLVLDLVADARRAETTSSAA